MHSDQDPQPLENDFIRKVMEVIGDHLNDEQFGVSELAQSMGMSRSNLLRKIKKISGLSVSQFIRKQRLEYAMDLLKEKFLSVSEISYRVGFSSPSYFIKCFHELYGYSPGEVVKGEPVSSDDRQKKEGKTQKSRWIIVAALMASAVLIALFLYFKPTRSGQEPSEKSIAVLPFLNDSHDSLNVHIMNGLMESVLTNLQQIEDLRVISRTSVEQYRNNPKLMSEIGQELNVRYLVEGSGQKIGEQMVLHLQLIEAATDRHIWAKKYEKNASDIFSLQREVARDIAHHIEAVITPEEAARIDKNPTENIEAYELFLVGLDLLHNGTHEDLVQAIVYFKKAITLDVSFARAYADVSIAYYFLDALQKDKQHTNEIVTYADQAFLIDPVLPQSLIAKALAYMQHDNYEMALPYLEKAHAIHPNSALIINILSDFYTSYSPNTEKYLEYALKGVRLDISSHDSTTASFIYLHISNAFIQTGFVDEALYYIDQSIAYDPHNLFAAYVQAFILYARDRDLEQTRDLLMAVMRRDTTRLDVLQEVGKIHYYLRDFEASYKYYSKFTAARDAWKLDIFKHENAKIAMVYRVKGNTAMADSLINAYKDYADKGQSIYKQLSLSMFYAYNGETDEALDHLSQFAQIDGFHYWTLLFLEIDPLVDSIKDHKEFSAIMEDMENRFWEKHKSIKQRMIQKGLL